MYRLYNTMFLESNNNNQCLLIILLGVALFLLMNRPHGSNGHRNRCRLDPFEGFKEVPKSNGHSGHQGPMTDNGATVVPVPVPERMPINEQSVGACTYKPQYLQDNGGGVLTEVPSGRPYVKARTNTVIDPSGVEGAGSPYQEALGRNVPENHYLLDDGANGEMSAQNNMVSGQCCGAQWPTPFKQAADPYVCGNKNDYVPSRMYGNNSYQDSGCLCQSKTQAQFLANRGNNGGGWQ